MYSPFMPQRQSQSQKDQSTVQRERGVNQPEIIPRPNLGQAQLHNSHSVDFSYSRSHRLGQNPQGFGTSLWGHWTSEFTTFSIFNQYSCNARIEEPVCSKYYCMKHCLKQFKVSEIQSSSFSCRNSVKSEIRDPKVLMPLLITCFWLYGREIDRVF